MKTALSLLQREPVRVYLYGVVTTILALLVATGVLTAALLPIVTAVVTAVLAVPAVEVARRKVSPTAKAHGDGLGADVPEEEWLGLTPADHLEEDEKAAVEAAEKEHN